MKFTVGVDEAGRGPLAGPVAVGLVLVAEDFDLLAVFPGLNDSKKLSEKKREALFATLEEQVIQGNVSYVVHMSSARDIDTEGISIVIRDAVETGLAKLLTPEKSADTKVWLDGSLHAPSRYAQETVIGGDALVPAIMLASIAAKVTRDRHLLELHAEYPQYGFDRHKGYGTKAHMEALREHGLSAIHRASFIHLDR